MKLARSRSLIVGAAILISSSTRAQVTQRVSVATGGAQGINSSGLPSVSADGRCVAFGSAASNLVGGDTNGFADVFVHDRQSGTTERVSVATGGAQGNNLSGDPSISADGRFVAFLSSATNLVGGDTNGSYDILVRDRQSGTTERVSVATGGAEGNNLSFAPSISADGRYVAFYSYATNLVPGDTNGWADVFVRDRQSGATGRVSVDSGGAQGNSDSYVPSISADGRFVAFWSTASNLVGGDTNGAQDVFIHDRQSGTTERVSVDSSGTQGNGASGFPSVSADGRSVAFDSDASNLVGGDTNGVYDVFVRDRQTGTTERVSVDSGGAGGNGLSAECSISADGRNVAFYSYATNLVPGDTNGAQDVFIHDRQSGTTERVSVDSSGVQGNNLSDFPSISSDGRYVAFRSEATNLVLGDTNGLGDVFVHDRDATSFTSLCDPGIGGVIPCPCLNPPAGSGRGCDNFGAGPADSGTLTATGVAYLQTDTIVLTAMGENNTSLTVFWTGSGALTSGVAHGAGVRCVGTALKRLYTGSASGGAISRPGMGDPSVSARTAAVGAPISAGETRHYFAIYRDPLGAGPCGNTSSTVNLTNAGSITWNL